MWAGFGTNGYSVYLWADINRECPTFFVPGNIQKAIINPQ